MNNQDATFSINEKRPILRILKFLVKAPALCDGGTSSDKLLLTSCVSGTIACENRLLQKLISLRSVQFKLDEVSITSSGKQLLHSLKLKLETDVPKARECDHDVQMINLEGQTQTVLVNMAESPLALLYRLSKQTGKRFLSDEEFQAGERLRADFTRGNMLPSITANWDAITAKRSRGERGGVADLATMR